MLKTIFNTLDELQILRKNKRKERKFSQPCSSGNKIGILSIENIHPKTRDKKSIFITVKVEDTLYSFKGSMEKNILYFSDVVVPHAIFRENFLIAILIEILDIAREYKIKLAIITMAKTVYFKRISVPFRYCGFSRSRGTTGDFYSFTANFTQFLK